MNSTPSRESATAAVPAGAPSAAIHVDLDGATDIYAMWGWKYPGRVDTLYESGLSNLLNLFEAFSIRATLFVIASSLEDPRKRALVEQAMRAGHEIASHTVTHPNLLRISSQQKRDEVTRSREQLQQQLGVAVRGFRAPGYLIDREGVEMLAAAGYAYDSSFFPTKAFAGRMQCGIEQLTTPHRPFAGSDFWELTLPDHRPSPVPFNPSYAHLFGMPYFRWGLRRHRRTGTPLVMLFHLIDAAAPLAKSDLPAWGSHVATLSLISEQRKVERCKQMLSAIAASYRIVPTKELLQQCIAARAREGNVT